MTATFGVVLLTMGNRPAELARAVDSVLAQRDVEVDVVVVGNGWDPTGLPEGVRGVHLWENLGIPAGRNAGVAHVTGEFLFFLDDDSWLLDDGFLAECAARLRADPGLGMIQPRILDPARPGDAPRRWIPRMWKRSATLSSPVFSVLETALVLPRALFDRTPGWPAPFFYAHEGIEMAWRVWDQGVRVEYHGDLAVGHPIVEPGRHDDYLYRNARNRIWLARRNLHWPVSWLYVASWTAVHIVRARRVEHVWWRGWRDGWIKLPWPPGARPRKLRWRTLWQMTRHGRLPIL
ncbi:MAG: glycosyltransferase [Arachnia sp.]